MNTRKLIPILCAVPLALAVSALTGCKPDEVTPPVIVPPAYDSNTRTVLYDLTQNVILPIVRDFDTTAGQLLTAINTLKLQKNEASLTEARAAWRKTRAPWETCEAFLFGPAKNQQLDPSVDAWPLDGISVDTMLHSQDQFSKVYFDNSDGTVKGAHAIEFLLWGNDGNKKVEDITDREYEFLVACTESFRDAAAKLKKAWVPTTEGGDDYAKQLYDAGKAGSLYTSQAAGVREVVTGMSNILRELSDAKMGIPYANHSTDFEEARYSGNSTADFYANVAGVQSMYMGTYTTHSGRGISDLVKAKDAALDTRIQSLITDATQRIGEIKPTFGEAIISNRNSVLTARTSISALADALQKDVNEKLGLTK